MITPSVRTVQYFLATTIVFLLFVLLFYQSVASSEKQGVFDESNASSVAHMIYESCATAVYRPTCYEDRLSESLGPLDPLSAMDVIRKLRHLDEEYVFCHTAAHIVGEFAVSLDTDNWLSVVAQGPRDGLCSFGFEHGAILGRFNSEYLEGDALEYAVGQLANACEKRDGFNPSQLQQAMCYHGIGHVLVHITNADIDTALSACTEIAIKADQRDFSRVCYEGVYMQLFQPLEPEDYALIDQLPLQPERGNLETFCDNFSTSADMYAVCWREAWPLFLSGDWGYDELEYHCSYLDAHQRHQCYVSGFTIHARHNLGTIAKLQNFCSSTSEERQAECFQIAALAYLEEDPANIDQAVKVCNETRESGLREQCYSYLANTSSFIYTETSELKTALCDAIPEKYRGNCR